MGGVSHNDEYGNGGTDGPDDDTVTKSGIEGQIGDRNGSPFLFDTLVFAARNDPGSDHGQDDHDVDQDESVGELELFELDHRPAVLVVRSNLSPPDDGAFAIKFMELFKDGRLGVG